MHFANTQPQVRAEPQVLTYLEYLALQLRNKYNVRLAAEFLARAGYPLDSARKLLLCNNK